MKVLHIISAAGAGGAELLVKDLLIKFSNKGITVAVAFLDKAVDVERDAAFEIDYISQLDAAGIQHFFIGSRARRNLFYGYKSLRAILNFFKPDIIHSHLYYGAVYAALASSKKTVNIYTHHSIKLGAPHFIYRLLDFRMNAYIAICNACRALLLKHTKKPILLIDNAVDMHRISRFSFEPKNTSNVFTFVLIGRLTAAKNLKLLFDSVKLLQNECFKVLIAGEGELLSELNNYVSELGISEKISFIGNVKNINNVLACADAFLLCSSWEGLPISQLEATAFGLPTIVTNVGGCAEVTHKVANGLVVEELNPEAYSQAMFRFLKDPTLVNGFKRNAEKYAELYSLDVSVDKHVLLYSSLIKENTL